MQTAYETAAPWAGFTNWFSGCAVATPAAPHAPLAPGAAAAIMGSPLRQLAAGASLLIERPQGVELVCLQGTLWVSQDDDEAEHIVVPGRPFVARHDGTLRVHAMSDSRCLMIAPHA